MLCGDQIHVCLNQRYAFRKMLYATNWLLWLTSGCNGTRIVQSGSGSDSDSESRRQNEEIIPVHRLTQTVLADPPEPATTMRTSTDNQRDILCADWSDL
jgi:hypothetical protein